MAGIDKMLQQLEPSKTSGPGALPNRVLLQLAQVLALVLTTIFQQLIDMAELGQLVMFRIHCNT